MDLGAALSGQAVLITGASSGIGLHLARLCARCHARVAIAARRIERLGPIADELTAAGARTAIAVRLDVTDEASIATAFATVAECFGALDVVVNNAEIVARGPALDLEDGAFEAVLDTNLRGVWQVSRAAARQWRDAGRGGAIVNIASILGLRVTGGIAPYAVSKAGVIQMTKVLALEWARHDIRVNALAPGYFKTPINEDFFATPAGDAVVQRVPMRRLGRLEDLDGPFLLLATPASRFMTGAVLAVDGGHLVSGL